MVVMESMKESILLLVKLQVLIVNGTDGACDRACFHLHDMVVHF